MAGLEQLARSFFGAFAAGNLDASAALLAEDVVSYVTNAERGVDEVRGRDAYLERIPDTEAAEFEMDVTQVLEIDDELVMTMVEIRAHRKGRDLHNHAAFLARVREGEITRLWMVEALPAYSDEFWS